MSLHTSEDFSAEDRAGGGFSPPLRPYELLADPASDPSLDRKTTDFLDEHDRKHKIVSNRYRKTSNKAEERLRANTRASMLASMFPTTEEIEGLINRLGMGEATGTWSVTIPISVVAWAIVKTGQTHIPTAIRQAMEQGVSG